MFCDSCQGVIDPSWQHCPACGMAIEAPAPVTGADAVPAPTMPVAPPPPPPQFTPGTSGPLPRSYGTPPPPSPDGPGAPPTAPPSAAMTPGVAIPSLPTGPPPGETFRSLRGLATALVWLLGAAVVVALGTAGAFFHRRDVLEQARSGQAVTRDSLKRADDLVGAGIGVCLLVGLAVLVVLIVFLFKAAKNTQLWDRSKARWSPGWTIGGWFVPLANLVIPALVVSDVWRRTPQRDFEGREQSVPGSSIGWWWASYVIAALLLRAGAVVAGPNPTVSQLSNGDLVRVAAMVCYAISSLLLITVVRSLSQRQEHLRHPALQPREMISASRRAAVPTR
jgi:hypothetical protein